MTYELKWIIPFVITAHLLILLSLKEYYKEFLPLPQKKMMAVKTVKLSPKKEAAVAVETKTISTLEGKAVHKNVKETKSAPKPAVKKAEQVTKKTMPKQDRGLDRKQELMALAKEKIGKIGSSSDKILESSLEKISTPKAIESLVFADVGGDFTDKELAYRDELASRLKLYLKLPEYGDVKIELKIKRTGKIEHLKILSFQSAKNAEYIEKNLPKVQLPTFKDAESYHFTIVMSNE